jgi:tetratricopeptide (TPR) repeat protein
LENRQPCIFFKTLFYKNSLVNQLNRMKKYLFSLGWMVVMSLHCYSQDAEIKNAQLLIDHGKIKSGIDMLQKATATYPEAAQLYYYLGQAQLLAGNQQAASASFDKGFGINPKEALNIAGQGQILLLAKKNAEAKVHFDQALKMGKKNIAVLQAIARAELSDKLMRKDAFTLLEKAKGINADNAHTHQLLGEYYALENNGGSAVSAYERAGEIDPKNGTPWYNIGLIYQRAKLIPMSEENLKKAIKADPEYALAHKELGELYYLKKDGANAVKHHKIYLDLTDSPEKDDMFKYAFYLFLAKDYTQANAEFKKLSDQPDVTSTTLKFYAQSLLKSGDLAESEKIFERYLNHSDTKPTADDYQNLGQLKEKQGKLAEAAVDYEKSLSLDPTQNDVFNTLIDYYFQKERNYSKAAQTCRWAIKSRKRPFSNDFFTLGRSNYFLHKYPQADSAFAKFIEHQPNIAIGYTWAARSKSVQDSLLTEGLAKPYYEKVIQIAEPDPDKYKHDLISAYQYMGSYFLIKQDNKTAKGYFEKVLALNPEDEKAKEAIKLINTPTGVPHKPKKK